MLHIAAGVCLGIVAAVYILDWLAARAVRREEKRRQRAYRRMARAATMSDADRSLALTDRVILAIIIVVCIVIPLMYTMAHQQAG